jgi:hypothetical protein
MGRHKGSKNRETLVRELTARGVAEQDIATAPHQDLEQKLAALAAANPPPPPVVEQTVIDPETAKALVQRVREKFDEMVEYYAPGKVDKRGKPVEVPERIHDFLRTAFHARDLPAAQYIAKRSIDKLFMYVLSLWTDKVITGPNTVENIEGRAKDAESWAKRLTKEGRTDEAILQTERARLIRASPPRTTPFHLWIV